MTIFDLDGTLADRATGRLLPGVARRFAAKPPAAWAIATNQGGVGLRRWMERHGFGEPDEFPTQEEVEERLSQVVESIGKEPVGVAVAFSYQARSGEWSPVPPEGEGDERWQQEWRKPAPGMLLHLMQMSEISDPEDVLMVGDSKADMEAAAAAGCRFQWADEYFERVYTVRPPEPVTRFPLRVYADGRTVFVRNPVYLDGLRTVLRDLRFQWKDHVWKRTLLNRHGNAVDRVIETALNLISAGYPVNVDSEDVRRRIIERDYVPEQTRWILMAKKGDGVFAEWGPNENFKTHLYRIPKIRVFRRSAFFPAEMWDIVRDFAEKNDFSISDKAEVILSDAEAAYDSAYVMDTGPLPVAPAKKVVRQDLEPNDFGVDEDLLDDEDLDNND